MTEKVAKELLDEMTENYFMVNGDYIYIERYTISITKDEVVLFTDVGRKIHQLSKLGSQMRAYLKVPVPNILPNENNEQTAAEITYEPERLGPSSNINTNMNTTDSETKHEEEIKEMDSPKTLDDLRNILMDNIKKIKNGELPLDKAREIVAHSNSIINITKVELEYRKFVNPKSSLRKGGQSRLH